MKIYTLGEIFKLGLLKDYDGNPYKHKATVSKYMDKIGAVQKPTRWGMSKCLTEKQIEDYNNRI